MKVPLNNTQFEDVELPCGCQLFTRQIKGVNTFIINPCDKECKNYKYVIEESQSRGKEIKYEQPT